MTTTTNRLIAVPWAAWAEELSENGKPVAICPECGLHVEEPNLKGRRYTKHYMTAHADKAS